MADIQNKPTILIGLGTSGLYVLEQVQNFFFENTGKNKPEWVEYLYIETNKDNVPTITALDNKINRVYVSLGQMQTMIREMKAKDYTTDWFPPEEHVLDAGIGAGGIPSCGRLAMWGRNNEGDNFSNVSEAIRNAFARVSSHTVQGSDMAQPAVFITGSLTGGTGTGAFLDLAYLVRHHIHDIKEIYSLLLLPPKPIKFDGNEIIYANTYGALRSLQYYNDADKRFSLRWPNGYNANFAQPPFELTQLISQSYNGTIADIHTLGGLYKIAGLYLFLNVIGLRAKRFERLVDAKGNWQIGKFSTFGLSAIQYPKTQIREHVALDFSSELLNRWVDQRNFYMNGQINPINRSIISNRTKEVFADMLKDAMETLNAAGGKNILLELQQEAVRINKGNHQGTTEQHITRLFSSQHTGNWYGTILNNLSLAQDSVVTAISSYISGNLNQHESLLYTRSQLECFADAIDETMKYWKSLGVSSQAANWENLLAVKMKWMLTNRYQFLFEQDNVLSDRMRTMLDLMRFHLFGKTLQNIRDNIRTGEIALTTVAKGEPVKLPVISKVDEVIRLIQTVLGTRENPRFKSLQKRMNEIKSDVGDDTIPILRIYPSQTFESECANASVRYKQATQQSIPSKDILMGNVDLWDYLKNTDGLDQKLYHDCIVRFGERLETVPNCILNYDVADYVRKNPQEARKIAQRSILYMLPIHEKTLKQSRNIPKMVIGSDLTAINEVVKKLQSEGFNEFSGNSDHALEIKELKNIMVFYIEQGNFTPTEDITYMEEVKREYEAYPKQEGGNAEKYWDNFRVPYVKTKDLIAFEKEQGEIRKKAAASVHFENTEPAES